MRIVITGASGNIGTALLRRLAADGDHDLVGISRRRPPPSPPYDVAEWHAIDVGAAQAPDRLSDAMHGAEAVVHLAWQIQPSHDRDQLRRVNQGGTRAVVEAVRRASVAHLVHLSSIGAYAAAPNRWVDETWSTAGIASSSYSVDKAACERMLDPLDDAMPVARVRPAVVLQEGAASEVARYFLGPLVPQTLIRPGLLRFAPWPRDLAVQFVHAADVADALAKIISARASGGFNLAAEPAVDRRTFRETFGGVGPPAPPSLVRALGDVSWRLRLQPTEPGWIDLAFGSPLMRTDRARDLGWAPTHSSIATLRSFVDALHRGQGETGPLLHPRRRVHPIRHSD